MRLHRLSVQAFGPFAGRVDVDVDALSEQGLFLLHGQTGSGKTSLLDAVCFALYGAVPGDRSTAGHLRSDHAAAGTPPEVVCELSIGERRFEVTRSPAWERPKKKGTGTTTQQAAVLVRELVDGEWVALANRLDEAGLLLSSALGMGMSQFTQVVLLPQGDFASFLRAGADDRKRLLEKLFGTETFSQVEDWLASRRREAAEQLRESAEATARLRARVEQASASLPALARAVRVDGEPHDGRPETADAESDPAERTPLDHAEASLLRAEHLHEAVRQAAGRARDDLDSRRTLSQNEMARHDRWTRCADARREHARLTQRAEAVADMRRRIDDARAAAGLRGHLEQLVAAESTRSLALARVTTAAQAVSDLGIDDALGDRPAADPGSGARTLSVLQSGISQRREHLGRLVELVALEEEHSARVVLRQGVTDELDAVEARVAAASHAADERVARRGSLGRRRDQLTDQASLAPAAAADLARAMKAVLAARDAARQQERVSTAEAEHLDAGQRSMALRTAHLDLLQQRLEGMAGELATALCDGAPCPVCGGTEHPSPAAEGAPVDLADVEAARATADRAQAAVDAAARTVAERGAALAAARTASGGLTADAADAEVRRLRQLVHDTDEAATGLGLVMDELAALDPLDEQAATELTELQTHRDEARRHLAELAARIDDVEQRLAAARGEEPTVQRRHARLVVEIEAMEHLTAAVIDLKPAESHLRAARATSRAAAADCGFPDLETARTAALDAETVRRLEAEVVTHDKALDAVVARLSEPDLVLAADEFGSDVLGADELDTDMVGAQGPDLLRSAERLPPARLAVVEAERTLVAAQARVTTASTAVRDLTGLVAQVRDLQKATEPLLERFTVIDALTGCVLGTAGDNTKRMRLSAYALAARLEQVAEAATDRLTAMSDGRYALQHSDGRGRGGARSGLGLQVVDHWTNQVRETGSLSGGETFLASLALALGLADVVQAEAGGLSIETLFVDEGFGTLDEETLDQVMTTLDGLREGGRAVGLVSHVTELRQRIPAQLQVVKAPTGSSVAQVRG